MSQLDYQRLDDVIHSRIRLAVMSILAGVEEAEFTYLRDRDGGGLPRNTSGGSAGGD